MRGRNELVERMRSVGLGASPPNSAGGYLSVPPADLAASSPPLALARMLGIPFAPYVLNISSTFTSASQTTLNPASFNAPGSITQPSIVDRLMFEVDQPQAFSGQVFKSIQDYFFGLQSGILATLQVTGAPRYTVAPYFTPIRSLCAMINEGWPAGWVLNHTQNIVMQFQASLAGLLVPPTTVTASFRLWQPFSDEFIQMTDGEARSQINQLLATSPVSISVPAQVATPPGAATPTGMQPIANGVISSTPR